ncbi:MAG: hypothetical protein LBN27_03335 [Prevotellaceae bacterium]|jgi:hypothetical protein|nr:hypothetical protein [Prevotellaceae bacterium]
MKTLKLFGLSLLLLFPATMFAQKYMMVYAPLDLYVDVQDNNGKRAGQVFNLEVVYVENEPTEQETNILASNTYGYIPSHYLVNIPDKYQAQIHKMWTDGALFISSTETPGVLVTVTSSDFRISDNGTTITFDVNGLYVSDLINNKLLDYVSSSSPYSITISDKKLTLESGYYYYSFYLDKENHVVRLLTPLFNRILPSVDENEMSALTLSQAIDAVGSAKVQEFRNAAEKKNTVAYNEMVRVIGFNNFDFLAKLGRLYADGDKQAAKLYPIVERYFPLDDEYLALFNEVSTKIWGLKNKGRTVID